MAQEIAATMKEGGLFSIKCGYQEGMKVEDDLIPTKRRCAVTKNFEMMEVVNQPRREQ